MLLKLKHIIILLLAVALFVKSNANVIINGSGFTISGICPNNGALIEVPDLVFTESLPGDFAPNGSSSCPNFSCFSTICISIPSGFTLIDDHVNVKFRSGGDIGFMLASSPFTENRSNYIRAMFQINGTFLLDEISISGIVLRANSNNVRGELSLVNIPVSIYNSISFVGQSLGTSLGTLVTTFAGNVFGWDSQLCLGQAPITVTGFPNTGTFSISTLPGALTTISSGVVAINPQVFSSLTTSGNSLPILLRYTYPGFGGCSVVSLTGMVSPLPTVTSFTLGATAFSNGISVTGTRITTSGANITGTLFGEAVANGFFFPGATTSTGAKNISYQYTNTLSGCTNISSISVFVYDPSEVFVFSPTPPLQTITGNLAVFCIDDPQTYQVALNPIFLAPPEGYFTAPGCCLGEADLRKGDCKRSTSITTNVPNHVASVTAGPGMSGGIYTTTGVNTLAGIVNYSLAGVRFSPSAAGVNTYNMYYNYQYSLGTSISGFSCPTVTGATVFRSQRVIVYDKPTAPDLDFQTSREFCLGGIPNDSLQVSTSILGALFKWYSATSSSNRILLYSSTSTGSSITTLGINNNTLPGVYSFGVSQVSSGCESEMSFFTLTITSIPTVPGISQVLSTLPSFCAGTSYAINLYPDGGFKPGVIYRWNQGTHPIDLNSTPTTTTGVLSVNVQSTTGFFMSLQAGICSSLLLGTVTGSRFIPVNYNPTPNSATGISSPSFCQLNTSPILTVSSINTTFPVVFDWYTNLLATNSLPGISNVTTTTGVSVTSTNFFQTSIPTTVATTVGVFVRTRSLVTGCASSGIFQVNIRVNALPPVPQLMNTNDTLLFNAPFCYNLTSTSSIIASLTGLSVLNTPTFEWRSVTTTGAIIGTDSIQNTGISTSLPGTYLFFVRQSSNSCFGAFKKFSVVINPPVVAPTLINTVPFYCTNSGSDDIKDLQATTSNITDRVKWFLSTVSSVAALQSSSFNPPLYDPLFVVSLPGTKTYFANATDVFGCVSTLSSVNLVLRQTPVAPVTFDTAYCSGNYNINPLRARVPIGINQQFFWKDFNNTTLLGTSTTTQPGFVFTYLSYTLLADNFISDDSKDFQIYQVDNGCPSSSSILNVKFFKKPSVPVVSSNLQRNLCVGNTLPIFTANSVDANPTFKWYADPMLVTTVANGANLNTNIIATSAPGWISASVPPSKFVVYVAQTTNAFITGNLTFAGCRSLPHKDSVMIAPIPPAPNVITPVPYCAGDVLNPLSATGVSTLASISWFNATTTGSLTLGTGSLFNTGIFAPINLTNQINNRYFARQRFNGCDGGFSSTNLIVNPLPTVSISGLSGTYCYYEPAITISGSPLGGVLNSTILGFSAINIDNAVFNPSLATTSVSSQLVTYSYTQPGTNCANSYSKQVQVYPTPELTFQTLNTLGGYCAYPGLIVPLITSSNVNGTGSLLLRSLTTNLPSLGINQNNQLEPFRAGVDTFSITYTFTLSGSNCSNSISQYFAVHTIPSVSFSISSFCEGDSITFNSNIGGVAPSGIALITWKFSLTDSINAASIGRRLPVGSYATSLIVSTNKNCVVRKDTLYEVKPYPVPDLSWRYICLGDSTLFKDKSSISSGRITTKNWNFGDSTSMSLRAVNDTTTNLYFKYAKPGPYKVSLQTISDKNCISDTSVTVHVLPYLSSFPRLFDFNTTTEGWFAEGKNSDWAWGTPNKKYIKAPTATDKVWVTTLNDTIYQRGQDSYLNSPCMDFSGLSKPMIAFDYRNVTFTNIDGVVLQYSIDNGISWQNVGDVNSGYAWYNSNNIFGRPGNQVGFARGWSGNTDTSNIWLNARNVLSPLTGRNKVRLRYAFGSTSNTNINKNQPLDGFSVNNVWIGDRTKIALLEQFTNGNDLNSANVFANTSNAAPGLDNLLNQNQNNIVAIKYHTSFPSADAFNDMNPSDVGTRVLFYGVSNVPYSILDGNFFAGPSFNADGDSLRLTAQNIDISTLNVPGFNINIDKKLVNNVLEVEVQIISNLNIPADTALVLHIAVIERVVDNVETSNGQTRFESVLKSMLPDAGGNTISQEWVPGASKKVSQKWNVKNVSTTTDQIGVASFVQSSKSKKVYQAAYNGPLVSTGPVASISNRLNGSNNDIWVQPNPVSNELTVVLPENCADNPKYELYDQIGNQVEYGTAGIGKKQFKIQTGSFAGGIYFLKVHDGNSLKTVKKVIVVH